MTDFMETCRDYRNAIFKTIDGYTPGEQPQTQGWIKLNTNENPYPPSASVTEVIRGISDNPGILRKYPDPMGEPLRSAIAQNFNLSIENVIVTNGSDEALSLVCRIFLGPGKKAIASHITYSLYRTLVLSTGAEYISAEMKNDEALNISLEALENSDADLIFLSNPNAQTGEFISLDILSHYISRSDKLWILDEAYNDFAGLEPSSILTRIREFPNVIAVRTFSKSHSLAGMRIGFAVSVNPYIIRGLTAGKDSYNEDAMALHVGKASMEDLEYQKNIIGKVLKERTRLNSEFLKRNYIVIPSHANFILIRPPEPKTAPEILAQLKERKILVRHFNTVLLSDFLRISIGTVEENTSLLKALDEIYSKA